MITPSLYLSLRYNSYNVHTHVHIATLHAVAANIRMYYTCVCSLRGVCLLQVMQKCDGVMASGHSVDTFAIPALQPLVLNLFVRPSREEVELEAQREVVLSMLLRVVDHSRVLSLLTHVLDCFSHSSNNWHHVSPMHVRVCGWW